MALPATLDIQAETRPMVLFICLGAAALSLFASFSLLAAAVIIH